MSERQQVTAIRVANVPTEEFERLDGGEHGVGERLGMIENSAGLLQKFCAEKGGRNFHPFLFVTPSTLLRFGVKHRDSHRSRALVMCSRLP